MRCSPASPAPSRAGCPRRRSRSPAARTCSTGARGAGTLLLPREHRTLPLLAAAVPVHLALSLGWAVVLERAIPRGREPLGGLLGGLAIAALDLELIGRRLPRIRALPQGRQWADHVAYGLAVGAVARRAGA